MLARILEWLELKVWQAAVGAMSAARPLSAHALRTAKGLKQAAAALPQSLPQVELQASPQLRGLAQSWQAVAAAGWLLGLALGYLLGAW